MFYNFVTLFIILLVIICLNFVAENVSPSYSLGSMRPAMHLKPYFPTKELKSPSGILVHRNDYYKFEINYPQKYRIMLGDTKYRAYLSNDQEIGFQYKDNQLENSLIDFQIWQKSEENSDLLNRVLEWYKDWLSYGPGFLKFSEQPGRRIIGKQVYDFTTPNGISGKEIYFKVEKYNLEGKVLGNEDWGPVILLDTRKISENLDAIILNSFSDRSSDRINLLRAIISSLKTN